MVKVSTKKTHENYELYGVVITRAKCGGYIVESAPNYREKIYFPFAAFTTKDEALCWVQENLRRSAA